MPVSFADPRNKPVWYPLVSARSRSRVSGDVLVKIGFVPAAEGVLFPSSSPQVTSPERLDAGKERELAMFFAELSHGRGRSSTADRVLTAPPTEGVGTIDEDDTPGGRLGLGVGMGDPDASDASDDDTSASDGETDGGSESSEDDEFDDFNEEHYRYTASPSPAPDHDPLAAAGRRLAEAGAHGDGMLAPPAMTSSEGSAATTPGGRRNLGFPAFMKRAGSSKSIASLRSLATNGTRTPTGESSESSSKGPGRLRIPQRLRQKSSSTDFHEPTASTSGSSEMKAPRTKRMRRKRRRDSPQVGPAAGETGASYSLQSEHDIVGICFVEIVSAHDLPRWRNMSAQDATPKALVVVDELHSSHDL
jgi:hypothetical protein